MSKQPREKYLTWGIKVLLYKEDFDKLQEGLSMSTCRTMSEYCRKLLLRKRISTFYRNQSLDAFINEAIELRKEMQLLRRSIPFTREMEMRLIQVQEEIKKCIYKIFDHVSQNKSQQGNI